MEQKISHSFLDYFTNKIGLQELENPFFSFTNPILFPNSKFIHINIELANELGWDIDTIKSNHFLYWMSGQASLPDSPPYAMAYGGHQFGHWAGRLGDGRALQIGHILVNNKEYILQLKGAGPTPYSRGADGLAVLRSSIREYLCSEAMYHLGIPTTRALSIVDTGSNVWRDMLYNGNGAFEPGAIVCRVSESFIRFGHFEWYMSTNSHKELKLLADYVLEQHYPELYEIADDEKYLLFWETVARRTIHTVCQWMRVGFTHGVMNTDNMQILGDTIDYGPFGFLDFFHSQFTPNITDAQHRRYAFLQQPSIAFWNIEKLGNALMPLFLDNQRWQQSIKEIRDHTVEQFYKIFALKLGFSDFYPNQRPAIEKMLVLLEKSQMDYTMFFRELSKINMDASSPDFQILNEISYLNEGIDSTQLEWREWFEDYQSLLEIHRVNEEDRVRRMNNVNPFFIIRNYMYQEAIDLAYKGNYEHIELLFELLKNPYSPTPDNQRYYAKMPDWARDKVGCSMLSCSS